MPASDHSPTSARANACGRKHPLSVEEAHAIQKWLIQTKSWRDLVIIMVGIDTLLRSVDLRHLKYDDVIDVHGGVRSLLLVRQRKTERTLECYLSSPTRRAIAHLIKVSGKTAGDYLFTHTKQRNDIAANTPISREALASVVKKCVAAIGLDPSRYSTKTLRCTRVRPILQYAGNDYQIPRQLLGHADIRSTVHYCAINAEEALEASRAVQFFEDLPLIASVHSTAKLSESFDKNRSKGR